MGITIFGLRAMLVPLHNLVAWFVRPPQGRPAALLRPDGAAPRACAARVTPASRHHERPRRPLRVVRVLESQAAPGAGRMVISGRMADVCAELDRLAALEAAVL